MNMPITIGFLLFNGVEELDFVGPYEAMSVWKKHYNGPENIVIISQEVGVIIGTNGLPMTTTHNFSNFPKLDYLVVPGGMGTRAEVNNEKLISFIRDVSKNCKAILSVCTGAFLLQAAGLLDGKKATTHWASLNRLRAFDKTIVIEERVIKDGNIWSSSGVSSGIDLALEFIAHTSGEEVAGKVQSYMEYYPSHKRYGNFHHSKDAPQYLKGIEQGAGRNSFSFFQSKQNIKGKFDTSLDISKIRPANYKDVRFIVEMLSDDSIGKSRESLNEGTDISENYYTAFDNIFKNGTGEIIVVENNKEEIIATVQINYIRTMAFGGAVRAQLEGMRVKQEYRGRGIGSELVKWTINRAKEKNCRIIQLTANKERQEAIQLYRKLGFKESHSGMQIDLDRPDVSAGFYSSAQTSLNNSPPMAKL